MIHCRMVRKAALAASLIVIAGCGSSSRSAQSVFTANRSVEFNGVTQTVSEGSGTARARVTISSASSQPVPIPYTLGGTGTVGVDYVVSSNPLIAVICTGRGMKNE